MRTKFEDYRDDVIYDVWRWGGNPDLVDDDRVQDYFDDGIYSENAASLEIRRQRENP